MVLNYGNVITHEPVDLAESAASASRASKAGRIILRIFEAEGLAEGYALDYKIHSDGTVIPCEGYEAIIEDGMLKGQRLIASDATPAPRRPPRPSGSGED